MATTTEELDVDITPRRTRTEEADLDITPMIDITSLLLAFFVVVSKMDAQIPVSMPKASSGGAIAEENCVVLVVTTESAGGESKIYKGQSTDTSALVSAESVLDKEAEIGEFVENEISNRPTVEAILIKADGNVRAGDIELIKRGIAGSDLALNRRVFFGVEEE